MSQGLPPSLSSRTKVAILGATGYAGAELARLLLSHPRVEIVSASSESYAGQELGKIFPHLRGIACRLRSTSEPVEALAAQAEVVFLCLPHGLALGLVPALRREGKKVIDFGADFRLRDPEEYRRWYGHEHTAADLLPEAVYGLPEIYRSRIASARLVANPGCYPTSVILAAAPLARLPGVDWSAVVADCKSGVSGAGRGLSLGTHFCEVNDSLRPYQVGGTHRHVPEIEQELTRLAGREARVAFTPHLVPMSRGMLTTLYVRVEPVPSLSQLHELYRSYYAGEPFVRVLDPGEVPATAQVRGSNLCHLGVALEQRTGRVLVFSALDNLGKGAAGQAVQNLNIMMGWPEETGLEAFPLFP